MAGRVRIFWAFAAIYVIWGSTYLAIRFAIESFPPFLMAAIRFLVAGGVLLLLARARGPLALRPHHLRAALFVGGLMLLGGNGGVVWAEQRVPSGIAALPIATVPLWTVLLEALIHRKRPGARVLGGILLGLAGLALLANPAGSGRVDPVGLLVLVLASLSWSTGLVLSRRAALPASPFVATAVEALGGGALLLAVSFAAGEPSRFALSAVSARSLLSLGYLIVFGSIVAFTAFVWLLRVVAPARVATYAYVNPVIAMLLGWLLAAEPLTARALVATGVIVGAVVLITTAPTPAQKEA